MCMNGSLLAGLNLRGEELGFPTGVGADESEASAATQNRRAQTPTAVAKEL